MATLRDILTPYRKYQKIALFSILAACFFEILDLVIPYAIGQVLNVLSSQPLDQPIQSLINQVSRITQLSPDRFLSLGVLLGLIFLVTVVKAPIQPWLGAWFHWYISLKKRRDTLSKAIAKILTLPLSFYDENNPGRIASRIAKGVENETWTYPEIAGQFIPKLARVLGIFGIIWIIESRIALTFLISFVYKRFRATFSNSSELKLDLEKRFNSLTIPSSKFRILNSKNGFSSIRLSLSVSV
jgi:ATP-binding cassette subfamily B protein